jgi:8-oxo-dGTP diphosphatase
MCERKFVLCADGVFVNDRKILLLRRNVEPFKGCWHIVGGHVKDDETFKQALKREYKEETNLDIEVGDIIDYRIEHTHDRTKIIIVLQVTRANGEIKLNHENCDYEWLAKTPLNSVCNYDSYLRREKKLWKNVQCREFEKNPCSNSIDIINV